MAFPPTKEKEEVREGEAPMKEAKKAKGKKKKDTEIEKGPVGSEGVTKANRSSMPALDDENNDACTAKKDGKKGKCGPCEHKNDSLTPQEYIAACKLGIQDRSRVYIRARLDAEERMDLKAATAKGKKCGNSYIPQQNQCNAGKTYAGGSKDPLSIRRGLIQGVKTGTKVGAAVGGVTGAVTGFQKGGITGALTGGALGALKGAGGGATAGAQWGALVQGARKYGRAVNRNVAEINATNYQFRQMKQGKGESNREFAARAGQTMNNQRVNYWSPSGEYMNQQQFKKGKKKDTESVWADGFGKFDAESALSANAMNLATDKYSKEKRKKHAQGQPRNIIHANTFNT